MLGSMRAMPNTVKLLGEGGANITQFRVNTPICCPSRATMLTGRFEHNNRMASLADGGCMHMNTSRVDNPGFWDTSPLVRLHKVGYTTGMFGKVLNDMTSYGCDGTSGLPPGVDRQVVMCIHTYFECDWVNDTVLTHTGSAPEDYTTSVMGNASIAWIKSVLDKGRRSTGVPPRVGAPRGFAPRGGRRSFFMLTCAQY